MATITTYLITKHKLINKQKFVFFLVCLNKNKYLISCFCKLRFRFLTQNMFQDPKQSGFKSGHSTETALIAETEKIQAARSAKLISSDSS